MTKNPEEQFEEILAISDPEKRIKIACTKFTNLEISAKTIRMLFDSLNDCNKVHLLNEIYSKENREKNMNRLPPRILIQNPTTITEITDVSILGTILKYELIRQYIQSKTEQRFYRFRNIISNYQKNDLIKISGNQTKKQFYKKQIDLIAIKGFIDELMTRREKQDISPLGLPTIMTVGIELEFVGPNDKELKNVMKILEQYGITYLDDFKIKHDGSVKERCKNPKNAKEGVEVVSSILDDTEESWKKLNTACLFIQAIGGKVNNSCGGHIHIGANVLGVDKEAWKTLLSVWREAEPLIYMISNKRGERVRRNARKFARMSSNDINRIDWTCVTIKNEEDIIELAKELHGNTEYFDYYDDRYKSLNLTNLIYDKKKTIEFRLSNGTMDYNILRENILLYSRLVQMAKMHSIDPGRKKKELEAFFERDLPEKEKLVRFLNLIFDDEKEKEVFYERWKSKAEEYQLFGSNSIQTYRMQLDREN